MIARRPELQFLLIRMAKDEMLLLNMDVQTPDRVREFFLACVAQYGAGNVQYCKIVSANIRTEVEFS